VNEVRRVLIPRQRIDFEDSTGVLSHSIAVALTRLLYSQYGSYR
jgi:hypothetical protein